AVLVTLVLAEHGLEALEEVLVRSAPGVVDAHRVVRGDRAVEEAPRLATGVLGAEPGKGRAHPPLLDDLVLQRDEIGARRNRSEHWPVILPAMPPAHETLPRGRSPFAAAFLSLLFPGLGHAYLGAFRRGLGYATPPLLIGALIAGFAVRMTTFDLAGLAVQSWFLIFVFVANLVALVYRANAIFDSWSIARRLNSPTSTPRSASVRQAGLASVARLAAVLVVMSGVHVAVARYDMILSGTVSCIFGSDAKDCGPTASQN